MSNSCIKAAGRSVWILVALVALALVVRIGFGFLVQRVDWDGIFYLIYAQNILGGDWLAPSLEWTPYPLGYPLAIAAVSGLVSEIEQAGLVVSLAAGALLVAPVWFVTRRLGSTRAAWLAGLLVGLNGVLVRYSVAVLSEALFTLLFLCLVWLWLRWQDRRRDVVFWLLVLVVELALVFVRPIGLAFAYGSLLACLAVTKERGRAALGFAVVAVLVTGLYVWYAQEVTLHLERESGKPQPSYVLQEMSRGLTEYYADDAEARAGLVAYVPGMATTEFLRGNAAALVRRYVYLTLERVTRGVDKAGTVSNGVMLPLYLVPLAALGFVRSGSRLRWMPVLGALPYVLVVPLFTADVRYYVPLVPLVLIYAGLGLDALVNWNGKLGWVVATAVLLVAALHVYQWNFHTVPVPSSPYKVAGLWLRDVEKPDLVLTDHPAAGFYAAVPFHVVAFGAGELPGSADVDRGRRVVLVERAGADPKASSICGEMGQRCELIFETGSEVTGRVDVYRVGY